MQTCALNANYIFSSTYIFFFISTNPCFTCITWRKLTGRLPQVCSVGFLRGGDTAWAVCCPTLIHSGLNEQPSCLLSEACSYQVLYYQHWGFDPVLTIRSVHCPSLGPNWCAQQPFRHFKCSALSKCWTHFMHEDPWQYLVPGVCFTAFSVGRACHNNQAKGATKLKPITTVGEIRLYATGSQWF